MGPHTDRKLVTISEHTIHRDDEARHFMRIKPVAGRVRILNNGQLIAQSDNALRLQEVGKDIYDPVYYIPKSDIVGTLKAIEGKTTYCPIKGTASYYDLMTGTGAIDVSEIAWCYDDTLHYADNLKGLIAFYTSKVVVEEHPA